MSAPIPPFMKPFIDFLEANDCFVVYLGDIDAEGLPDVVATKNGANYVARLVPDPNANTVSSGASGFPLTSAQKAWDDAATANNRGTVFRFASTSDFITLLNATPVPT